MEHDMILSASGWRKVFAESGDENDIFPDIGNRNRVIAALAAEAFSDYILDKIHSPSVILGIDSRPTGPQIAETMIRVLMAKKIAVSYTGIIAAPQIMAYAHTADAFVYISASHNPIGHNGIKFGLNDGSVLSAEENRKIAEIFKKKCALLNAEDHATNLMAKCPDNDLDWVFAESVAVMHEASSVYHSFAKEVISGTGSVARQNKIFAGFRGILSDMKFGVAADMNGSARTLSIDASFLKEVGIEFHAINNHPGQIAHEIIPEPENLIYVSEEIERLQDEGKTGFVLGYMPDCDGDRGNFVVWNRKDRIADVIEAQEVFALSVLSELAYTVYMADEIETSRREKVSQIFSKTERGAGQRLAVAANGPTSMRIEKIARAFGAEVFRAEVGEANVVNLAREKRSEGYTVRILGEGSNGGNITHPAAVRDPLNTLFALLKLLILRDTDGKKGLFHLWCDLSGQGDKYKEDFDLVDILETLPKYATTGVSEKRAILDIRTEDHSVLKGKFQKIFEKQWESKKEKLLEECGIASYEAVTTNETVERSGITDFSESGRGGLKIKFLDREKNPVAFIWMRGSGTERVFRVLADVSSEVPDYRVAERRLLEWETNMILKADES